MCPTMLCTMDNGILESNLKRVFLCPVLVAAKPPAETDRGIKAVFPIIGEFC